MRAKEFIMERGWFDDPLGISKSIFGLDGNSDVSNPFKQSDDEKIDNTDKTGQQPSVSSTNVIPLATNGATQGKIGQVLNFVAKYESNGNYNVIFGGKNMPLTKMTIAQIYQLQQKIKRSGSESSAVGRYQFMPNTLRECVNGMGLDPNTTLFDEKTQDALIIYRLRKVRQMDQWLNKQISNEQFLFNLSQEFASLPNPKSGESYHKGVGSNKAGTGLQAALNTLSTIQTA